MGLVRLIRVLLAAALTAACASSGAVPRPFPGVPEAPRAEGPPARDAAPEPAGAAAAGVVDTALSLRGVPYRNGGSDPSGFDCSGFVQYVFAQHGVVLPREVREQVRSGDEVRLAGIAPGDLIFFAIGRGGVSHGGLAIGGDEFVHAPSARGVVRLEKFSAPYWARRIVEIRRVR